MTLSFQNVSKSYGKLQALDQFSIDLNEGIYALLGPNGAGKTTLLNILVDNLDADTGEILFDGQSAKKMGPDFRKLLGYMPQQQQVYRQFTAQRFLYYMAALKGLTKAEAKQQVDELLTLVNLEDSRHKKLGAFSGGMKQRILIAQALLGNPKILIMDEPTAGLDPKERIRIRNLISKISFNRIVIIATHVVSDIEFIAKEILFLRKGILIEHDNLFRIKEKMTGKVFELLLDEEEANQYIHSFRVSGISKETDGVHVRMVTEDAPEGGHVRAVTPNLEDMYLYLFGVDEE